MFQKSKNGKTASARTTISGTCVQYPGLQGAGALGDASAPGTLASSIASSTHRGTCSHVAVAGEAWSGKRDAAGATAATATRRRGATPTVRAITPPLSAPARGRRGGRHGARGGGWDRPPRDGTPLTAPVDGVSNRRRAAATSRRAGTITRGSSWALRTPEVAARGRRAQLGAVGGGRGAGAVRAL